MHPGSVPPLGHQLHNRLEEIDVEAEDIVGPVQISQSSLGCVAVISYQTPYHCPVLLLHMAAIVLIVRASASEGNPLPLAIGVEVLIDELAAIV